MDDIRKTSKNLNGGDSEGILYREPMEGLAFYYDDKIKRYRLFAIKIAVARGPTSRMFILSPVLEIRPVGCTFQALGYISERSRAKKWRTVFVSNFEKKNFSSFSLHMSAHDSN